MAVERAGGPKSLGEVNPDLDAKIDSMFKRSLFSVKTLSRQELVDGLSSEAGPEFFARIFTKGSSFRSLMGELGDSQVQDAVLNLVARSPHSVDEALKSFADSKLARKRMRDAMDSDAGQILYSRIQQTEAGNEFTAMVYNEPMSWDVWGSLGRVAKKAALLAKIKLPQTKRKESVEALQDYVRPSSTNFLGIDGISVDDAWITELLNHPDLETRYGVVSEFFSSSDKTRRLSKYLADGGNRELLVKRLSENKPRALLAILDALATGLDGRLGISNFAQALADGNCSQVLEGLARGSLEDQELIYAAFNSHYRGVLLGKEVMKKVYSMDAEQFDTAVRIQDAVNSRRRQLYELGEITKTQVGSGLGDVPLDEVQVSEIIRARV